MPKLTFQWNSVPKLTLGAKVHRLPNIDRPETDPWSQLRCWFRNKFSNNQKFKPHKNAKLTEWDFWLFWHVWLIYFMLIDMIPLILQYPWISVHVHDCPFSELVLLFGISERSHIGPIFYEWDLWGHSIPACSELLFLITKPSSLTRVVWNEDNIWIVKPFLYVKLYSASLNACLHTEFWWIFHAWSKKQFLNLERTR